MITCNLHAVCQIMLEIVLTVFCFVLTFRMSLESNKLPLWGVKLSQQPITKVSIAYFFSGLGIRSDCSIQMSDCEQFAQIVQDK